jgi:2-polyprenyl-3-methyl-5-hydroxy-6-metoxy-1,4-benzoquinol methylase
MNAKELLRKLIKSSPFSVRHIGNYIRELWFFRIIQSLPLETFTSVLDAGCGGAQYSLKMAILHPHIDVTAIDIETPGLTSGIPPNFCFRRRDILDLDESTVFDFIYSLDVLEHIPHNETAIEKLVASLKPGGYLYVHMPGKDSSSRFIFPTQWFTDFQSWAKKEHIGETYSLSEIVALLTRRDLSIVQATHTFAPVGQLAWELDRLTDRRLLLKIVIMPLLKMFSLLNMKCAASNGDFFVLARKTE